MRQLHRHRTLQRMVEDQIRDWATPPVGSKRPPRSPVVAISRQEGTHGEAAARALADELGMDFYDREIVHLMAETAHIRERVIRSLDERAKSFIEDLFTHLLNRYGITSDEYFDLLGRTIGAIDWHGNAVIVGRGAAHIVRRPENLTVRFVAPLEERIAILCSERGLRPRQAHDWILESDRARNAFLYRYFRTTAEAEDFDVVIDNRYIGLEASVEILKAAVLTKIERVANQASPVAS